MCNAQFLLSWILLSQLDSPAIHFIGHLPYCIVSTIILNGPWRLVNCDCFTITCNRNTIIGNGAITSNVITESNVSFKMNNAYNDLQWNSQNTWLLRAGRIIGVQNTCGGFNGDELRRNKTQVGIASSSLGCARPTISAGVFPYCGVLFLLQLKHRVEESRFEWALQVSTLVAQFVAQFRINLSLDGVPLAASMCFRLVPCIVVTCTWFVFFFCKCIFRFAGVHLSESINKTHTIKTTQNLAKKKRCS